MQLNNYYSSNGKQVYFSRQQASDFAKSVANDFNPLHDIDAKRFCVPGDLLFVVAMTKTGLCQHMSVTFADMVGENVALDIMCEDSGKSEKVALINGDKEYLTISNHGQKTQDPQLISDLSRAYVSYSGKAFPHILVPLMQSQSVMINPTRPLVIYESAELEFKHLDFSAPSLRQTTAQLNVDGKRGTISLCFDIYANEQQVGHGKKSMLLSGLREYQEEQMNDLVNFYNQRKVGYRQCG